MEDIRLLSKDDIDVRVAQTTTYNGYVRATLLLYKNARVDMKIMDELFTPMGWKRSHKLIGDRLYCQVEVWDAEKKEWIVKEDVGVESNTEAEKGQASDAFKRACVNWGIGRELYTAPKVVVLLNENEFTKDQNGRIRVWASFHVGSISYDAKTRTIVALEIHDKDGNVRFGFASDPAGQPKKAVKKTAAKKDTEQPYEPLPDEDFKKVVVAYAKGMRTKTGGDYKDTWIALTHAKAEQIAKFDQYVEELRNA